MANGNENNVGTVLLVLVAVLAIIVIVTFAVRAMMMQQPKDERSIQVIPPVQIDTQPRSPGY